jgi:hypothetical protein
LTKIIAYLAILLDPCLATVCACKDGPTISDYKTIPVICGKRDGVQLGRRRLEAKARICFDWEAQPFEKRLFGLDWLRIGRLENSNKPRN